MASWASTTWPISPAAVAASPTSLARGSTAGRPSLTPAQHGEWREVIALRFGLDFGPNRREYLARRLWGRVVALGLGGYDEYLLRLRAASEADSEWTSLVEVLVNHETSFFRHGDSFVGLARVLARRLEKKDRDPGESLDLWSVGCSSGEEVFSLAMVAREAVFRSGNGGKLRVLGMDISPKVISRARSGRFPERRVRRMSEERIRRFFRRSSSAEGAESWEATPELRGVTRFEVGNLIDEGSWTVWGQDAIFCQNLLIYLRAEQRLAAVARLAERLKPGGALFLAPGELVGHLPPGLRSAGLPGCTAFVREPAPGARPREKEL